MFTQSKLKIIILFVALNVQNNTNFKLMLGTINKTLVSNI